MNDDAVVDRNALMVVFPVPNVAWWGDELCGATSQSIEIINYLGLRRRVAFSFQWRRRVALIKPLDQCVFASCLLKK